MDLTDRLGLEECSFPGTQIRKRTDEKVCESYSEIDFILICLKTAFDMGRVNLLAFYLSLGLTVVSNVLYHIFQKLTPGNVNPMVALSVTYAVATILCLILFPFFPSHLGLIQELRKLNWASFGLAFAVAGLELGYLWAYRAGWDVSVGPLVSNVAVALLLLPVGLLLFKERLTSTNIIGIILCIFGLILINQR
jgi:uncharacterized membrane protein